MSVATTDATTGQPKGAQRVHRPGPQASFLATQLQSTGYFQLKNNEALVLTINPGKAGYFSVPVTNDWTITNNYWDQPTSLNIAQSVAESRRHLHDRGLPHRSRCGELGFHRRPQPRDDRDPVPGLRQFVSQPDGELLCRQPELSFPLCPPSRPNSARPRSPNANSVTTGGTRLTRRPRGRAARSRAPRSGHADR